MKWYERDCDAALVGMRELSDIAYRGYNVLLDVLYSRNGDVSDDDRLIAKHIGWRPQRWRRAKMELIEKGKVWITADGKLMAKRVEKTLKRAKVFSGLQSDRANSRWKNNDAQMPRARAMPPHTQEREKETSNQEEVSFSLSPSLGESARATTVDKSAPKSQPQEKTTMPVTNGLYTRPTPAEENNYRSSPPPQQADAHVQAYLHAQSQQLNHPNTEKPPPAATSSNLDELLQIRNVTRRGPPFT